VRLRAAALAVVAAAVPMTAVPGLGAAGAVAQGGAPPGPPPPGPPPVAFRSATLYRADHLIEVELMATVVDAGVTVLVSRHGRRLGRSRGVTERSGATVSIPIGPRGLRMVGHGGRHVDVLIYYGGPEPLRAHPVLRMGRAGIDPGPQAAAL
jgi:hypothetical protein